MANLKNNFGGTKYEYIAENNKDYNKIVSTATNNAFVKSLSIN